MTRVVNSAERPLEPGNSACAMLILCYISNLHRNKAYYIYVYFYCHKLQCLSYWYAFFRRWLYYEFCTYSCIIQRSLPTERLNQFHFFIFVVLFKITKLPFFWKKVIDWLSHLHGRLYAYYCHQYYDAKFFKLGIYWKAKLWS